MFYKKFAAVVLSVVLVGVVPSVVFADVDDVSAVSDGGVEVLSIEDGFSDGADSISAFASAPIPLLITIGFRLLLAVYNAAEIPAGPAPMMITSSILSPAFLIHISLLYNIHYFVKNFSIYSYFCSFIIREISDFLKRICFI